MKKILKNILRWGTFGVCWFAFIGIVKAIFFNQSPQYCK